TMQDLTNFYQEGLGIDAGAPANPAAPPPGATLAGDPANPNSVKLVITGDAGTANALSLAGNSLVNQNGVSPFTSADGPDATGKLKGAAGDTINIDRTGSGAKSPMSMKLDFSGVTSLASNGSTLVMTNQDGSQIGTLESFSVGADGTISGSYNNGQTKTLGQV